MKRRRQPSSARTAKLGILSSLQIACFLLGRPGWAFTYVATTSYLSPQSLEGSSRIPFARYYEHHISLDFFKSRRLRSHDAATSLFATMIRSDAESTLSNNGDNNDNNKNKHSDNKNRPSKKKKKSLSKGRKRYIVKSMFRQAKALERQGRWKWACAKFQQILDIDPYDAHSHLALARLQARREQSSGVATTQDDNKYELNLEPDRASAYDPQNLVYVTTARETFERGTALCPYSIHLWQAWAVHEETHGNNIDLARQLFEQALSIDSFNPYVCHAYGLMEKNKCQQLEHAKELWQRALSKTCTAALVCSLGELFIAQKEYDKARWLYQKHLPSLASAKDKTEVYLAMAWLEERYYEDFNQAHDLLQRALEHFPTSSLAHVALARLEGRQRQLQPNANKRQGKRAVVRRLANACIHMEQQKQPATKKNFPSSDDPHDDGGRVYNAWALMEVKDRNYDKARRILAKGIERYPNDPMVRNY